MRRFLAVFVGFFIFSAATMGLLLTIPFVSSLANRSGPVTALPAAGGFLLGGAILMLFAFLFAWLQSHRSMPRNEVRPNRSQPPLTTRASQLTLTSPLLRFSLLRAVGAAVAAASGWISGGLPFYWAALTVIICTQQDRDVRSVPCRMGSGNHLDRRMDRPRDYLSEPVAFL